MHGCRGRCLIPWVLVALVLSCAHRAAAPAGPSRPQRDLSPSPPDAAPPLVPETSRYVPARWAVEDTLDFRVIDDEAVIVLRSRDDPTRSSAEAVSIKDGTLLWSHTMESGRAWPSFVAWGSVIVFQLGDIEPRRTRLVAFDVQSGELRWEHERSPSRGGSAFDRQRLVVWSDGRVDVLDLATGRALWSVPGRAAAVGGNTLFVVSSGPGPETVSALALGTGAKRWSKEIDTKRMDAFREVCLVYAKGELVALSPQNGAILWEQSSQEPQQAFVAGNNLIYATHSELTSVDPATGRRRWWYAIERYRHRVHSLGDELAVSQPVPRHAGTQAVVVDPGNGRLTRRFSVLGSIQRMVRLGQDWVVNGAHGRVARLEGSESALLLYPNFVPTPPELERVVRDPFADPDAVATELRDMEPAWFRRLAAQLQGWPSEDVGRLGRILDASSRMDAAFAQPLIEALPELEGETEHDVVHWLAELADARSSDALGRVLEQPPSFHDSSHNAARREALFGLVRIATNESLTMAARALDEVRRRPTSARDTCRDFPGFCTSHQPDSDGDGWSDTLERRFLTSPTSPDTDHDGLADAEDPCPLKGDHSHSSEADRARQAAFSTEYLNGGGAPVLLGPDRPCYGGAGAPLLHLSKEQWASKATLDEPAVRFSIELSDPLDELPIEGQRLSAYVVGRASFYGYGSQVELVYRKGRWLSHRLHNERQWIH